MKSCSRTCRPTIIERLEDRKLLTGYSVHALGRLGLNDTGADPQSPLVMDVSGNLFGTTPDGGAYGNGTVYEVTRGSSTITALAAFEDNVDAQGPLVIDENGNLFGATFYGGAGNYGSIFEVVKGSGVISTLVSFSSSLGTGPVDGLVADTQGNLYGNTTAGGIYGNGTIFKLPRGASTPIVLSSIDDAAVRPRGGMAVDASGDLFGITNYTVYELPVGASKPNTVGSFPSFHGPTTGVLLDQSGNVFGATESGGANGKGSLFEIVKGSGTVTTLASFNESNGDNPTLPAMDSLGNLYGNTWSGGSTGGGVVYKLATGSGMISVLGTFAFNGGGVGPSVVVDAAGNVSGITPSGGQARSGRIYQVASGGTGVVTVASFAPSAGSNPNGGIFADSQGNLWGTVATGGAFGFGALFEVDPVGNISIVASFNGANGELPNGNVVLDDNGNVYGTTNQGGAYGRGNVFEWVRGSGNLVSLVDFDGSNGSQPANGLVRDRFGNIFGTEYGFSSGPDFVFKLSGEAHVFSTIATLNTSSSGVGNLAVDAAGNIYGTTDTGVFEIASGTSIVTTLATFSGSQNGSGRDVAVDANGNVFGTTYRGGALFVGSVYEIVKGSNAFSTIVSFGQIANMQSPSPELRVDDAGNIYGILGFTSTTTAAIYEIPAGTASLSILTPFNHLTAIKSFVRDADGTFRGVLASWKGDAIAFEAVSPNPNISLRRDPDQVHIDWTIGSKSGTVLASDARGLNIAGDGGNDAITLDYSYGNPLPHVIHLDGTFTIAGIEGDDPFAGTTVDVGEGTIYLNYLPGSGLASSVRQDLRIGYDNGDWRGFGNGPVGAITSLNSGGPYAVGFADSADGTVQGQPANTIEIRFTVMGDANLDGVVNSLDAITTARNYLGAGVLTWDMGDFNFDGSVNINDAGILQKNFNRSVTSAPGYAESVMPVVVPSNSESTQITPTTSRVAAQAPQTTQDHGDSDDPSDRKKRRGRGKRDVDQESRTRSQH
jgi:uncharacterized repeat protein (TIGR03803 family)